MAEDKIETLAQFVRLIEEKCRDQSDVLFRGQPAGCQLLPSIARENPTDDILAIEQSMLEEFQRHSHPFLRGFSPATLWEWMALARHHGLPTRLLDWSLNPFTALWFTVQKPSLTKESGVLWILRPAEEDFATTAEMNTLECQRHKVFAPLHVTERITAQIAWFTVHKARSKPPVFEPLEDSEEFASKITKVLIPADRFAHLRFHLDRFGANHASAFSDLDGLCAHIRWKRYYMTDEGRIP
jgi:hypothetical protein